jgi:hypothetical protein
MRSFERRAVLLLLGLLGSGLVLGLCSWRPSARISPTEPVTVSGHVTDHDGPVAGARVRFQGGPGLDLTDSQGRFRLLRHPGRPGRVTAAKEGYLIAGAAAESSRLTLRLEPLPGEDFEEYSWVDPVPEAAQAHNCGNCHGEVYREWAASSHARAATDRHFLNLYDGSDWRGRPHMGWDLLADHPAGAGVCSACHAPTAGFEADLRQLSGVAARGVHCDYCHKIVEAPADKLGLTHGRYGLKLKRPAGGQLFFGPLDDVDRGEDSFSPLYGESRYCASCHEGVVFGVHVYSTYSEWLASPARREGKQCQTCHMRPTGTLTDLAPGKGGIPRDPQTLASHHFPGHQPEMLRRCLQVEVSLERDAESVRVQVEVRARSVGHRVPTGFVDRNLVLLVEAFDGQGMPIPARAGPVLPTLAGRLAGLPGKLYAKQLKDFQGTSPVPFWRAAPDLLDTRLVPEQADRTDFIFPKEAARLQVRLLYRFFWEEVAQSKEWPDNEITVVDQLLSVPSQSGK